MRNISAEDLAGLLFSIHQHDEHTEKIIYFEEDLIPVLKALGSPEPIWGKALSIEEYLKDLTDKSYDVLPEQFFKIPLDIEGSNIENTGWEPTSDNIKWMDEKDYNDAVEDYKKLNAHVIFKNVGLHWDSCDCGDGYGCGHGSWVYEITIHNGDKIHTILVEDDSLYFGDYIVLPSTKASIGDFHRAAKLAGMNLELSDYGKSLL